MSETTAPPKEALENRPAGDLFVKVVKNCVVTRSSLVITATGVDPACLFEGLPLRKRIEMNLVGLGSIAKSPPWRLKVTDPLFHVFNIWGTGYHHWLTEVAPKFFLFEDEIRGGTVILPEKCPKFVFEFLDLFSFENFVQVSGSVFIKKLNLISNPNSGHFNHRHLQGFRERSRLLLAEKSGGGPDRIYVSRRNARARRVVNEEEVVGFFRAKGFECLELDEAPFVDQVRAFANCQTLVSIHGAALTNMLLMPENGRVLEIYPAGFTDKDFFNACFRHLADALDQQHEFLFCERENPDSKFSLDTDNVVVNIDELEHKLAEFE